MKLVSVIIPIYNVEQYLNQCVQSVVEQTYKNLEIILVDDGSPDQCGKMCDAYAKNDQRIKVIHKENGGLSEARNIGIDSATGEYIAFIDSDDFVMPDMIERLLDILLVTHADISQCRFVRCNDEGEIKEEIYPGDKTADTVFTADRMAAYLRDETIDTMACGKLYDSALFKKIRYPVGKLHEDVFTTYKLIHASHAVAVTDYIGYVYRINKNGIVLSQFKPQKLDSIYGKIEQADFIVFNYPELKGQAYAGVIYACNQCLMLMGKSKFGNSETFKWLQGLYRKYGHYYIKSPKTSKYGRIAARIAWVNVRLMWLLFWFVHPRKA